MSARLVKDSKAMRHDALRPIASFNATLDFKFNDIEQGLDESKKGKLQEILDTWSQARNQLVSILNRFVATISGKTELKETVFNINTFKSQIQTQFEDLLKSHGIELDINIRFEEFPETAKIDQSILLQALENIITNAQEHITKNKLEPKIKVTISNSSKIKHVIKIEVENPGTIDESKINLLAPGSFSTKTDDRAPDQDSGYGLANAARLIGQDLTGDFEIGNSKNGRQNGFKDDNLVYVKMTLATSI